MKTKNGSVKWFVTFAFCFCVGIGFGARQAAALDLTKSLSYPGSANGAYPVDHSQTGTGGESNGTLDCGNGPPACLKCECGLTGMESCTCKVVCVGNRYCVLNYMYGYCSSSVMCPQ